MTSRIYDFGEFRLNASTRSLSRAEKRIALTPKAFDLLMALIENRQRPIRSKDLISSVWDEENVTHNNFAVTLNSVRRALGETAKEPKFIVRFSAGYQFVGLVREIDSEIFDLPRAAANETPPQFLLPFPFGAFRGFAAHLTLGSSLYAMLFAIALVLEVAYRFDQFGKLAQKLAPLVFIWVFVTSVIGLGADRILTLRGRKFGLSISISIFLSAAVVLFLAVRSFLPSWPITQATFETYPAQAAFLKDVGSFFILAFLFFLLPSHFAFMLRHSLSLSRSADATKVSGHEVLKAAARRALYPRFSVLCSLLVVFAVIAVAGTAHLLDNLKPAPYHNLFVQLLYLREILYFSFGLCCLLWYYRVINDIKANASLVQFQVKRA